MSAPANQKPLPPRWRRLLERVPQAMTAETVPSPCQSVCTMHAPSGWCEGCLRSLQEIAAWSRMPPQAQRAVWAELPQRLQQRQAQDASA